ncbi:MAG: hypothetical protein OSA97_09580 [Nevskia sp.]|nr:hypothetical protein [Nevskia sp.]
MTLATAPDEELPEEEPPEEEAPEDEPPEEEPLEEAAPEDEPPEDEAPEDDAPEDEPDAAPDEEALVGAAVLPLPEHPLRLIASNSSPPPANLKCLLIIRATLEILDFWIKETALT